MSPEVHYQLVVPPSWRNNRYLVTAEAPAHVSNLEIAARPVGH